MADILPYWLIDAGTTGYSDISTGKNGLANYLSYADLKIGTNESTETDASVQPDTLRRAQPDMIASKSNTLDLFMQ